MKNLICKIESSGRHVHLTPEAVEVLFGAGYELQVHRPLFQNAGSVYAERLEVVGPKGSIRNVALLGPLRGEVQVELSLTDARQIGVDAPIRLSGHVEGSAPVTLVGPAGRLELKQGAIIAQRHIHVSRQDAQQYGLSDGDVVQVRITGQRALIWDEMVVRVRTNHLPLSSIHIDYDEANSAALPKEAWGEVLKNGKERQNEQKSF